MRSNPLAPFSNTLPVSSTELHSFIEVLCRHAFIVRVGPKATSYGKLWEAQVTGHIVRWWQFWYWRLDKDWFCTSYVIFKGFAGGRLETEKLETMVPLAIATVNRMYSLPVRWKRLNNTHPYWLLQVSGVNDPTGRTIKMHKVPDVHLGLKAGSNHEPHHERHHHDKAKNTITVDLATLSAQEPHVDQQAAAAAGIAFWTAVQKGEMLCEGGTQVDLGNGRIFGGGIFKPKA